MENVKLLENLKMDDLSEKRQEIINILDECKWIRRHTAKRLNMSESALFRLIYRLQIQHPSGQWPTDHKWIKNLEKKDFKTNDIVIEQSPKILISKSLLNAQEGLVTINIVMNQTGNTINSRTLEKSEEKPAQKDFELFAYLESLPQPRIRNFINKIYDLVMREYPEKTTAAEWLGINSRTLYRYEWDKLDKGVNR